MRDKIYLEWDYILNWIREIFQNVDEFTFSTVYHTEVNLIYISLVPKGTKYLTNENYHIITVNFNFPQPDMFFK